MSLTNAQKVESLLRLPWTVQPAVSDGYLVARVAELPGTIATGETPEELERDFWESLRATLECLVENDDEVPLPARVKALPWLAARVARPRVVRVRVRRGDGWEERRETVAPNALSVPA